MKPLVLPLLRGARQKIWHGGEVRLADSNEGQVRLSQARQAGGYPSSWNKEAAFAKGFVLLHTICKVRWLLAAQPTCLLAYCNSAQMAYGLRLQLSLVCSVPDSEMRFRHCCILLCKEPPMSPQSGLPLSRRVWPDDCQLQDPSRGLDVICCHFISKRRARLCTGLALWSP